jgi:hypothetical protein
MKDAQHHDTLTIKVILKYIGGAKNLQNDLAVFLSPGNGPPKPRMAG